MSGRGKDCGRLSSLVCLVCSKAFYVTPFQIKRGGRKTCSLACCKQWKCQLAATQPKTNPICHPERRHKGNGLCASCYRIKLVASYTGEHAERARARIRFKARVSSLARTIKRPYREVELEVLALLAKHNSCEVCGSQERLCIDHDHATGKIRGLLCGNHNFLLGFAQDNQDTLHNCIRYLMKKEHECRVD